MTSSNRLNALTNNRTNELPQLEDVLNSAEVNATADDPQSLQHHNGGSECRVKTLYEGPSKCKCCINWVEEYPKDIKASVEEEADTKAKAIVARVQKAHEGSRSLSLHSVVIQNRSLKNFLREVFEKYKGITATLERLVFSAPFYAFYYRWDRFTQLLERHEADGTDAAPHARLLHTLLLSELGDKMRQIADLRANKVVMFELLWALFEPGTKITYQVEGEDCFALVQGSKFETTMTGVFFVLKSVYVDWDGEKFGYRTKTTRIPQFNGTCSITDLPVYPDSFASSLEEKIAHALERGKRFYSLKGTHYMEYSGMALELETRPKMQAHRRLIESRVMVDASSFSSRITGIDVAPLESDTPMPDLQVEETSKHETATTPAPMNHFGIPPPPPSQSNSRSQEPKQQPLDGALARPSDQGQVQDSELPKEDVCELSEQQLLLCGSELCGFSLKTKKWVILFIQNIRQISWNETAFENLVLPPSHKNLVLSFIEGHSSKKIQLDDIIEGKGLGITMLLVGSPGTGKTLTAEAVADKVRQPLYIMSAGELGDRAREVDSNLDRILKLTEKWNAVLLLDECDVFLQTRTSTGLAHNGIVAVFLRMIEYYKGILIMTTNRADAIDSAFQSRIHLTMHYPILGADARMTIWKQFVQRAEWPNDLNDEHLRRLAELDLNGRQIKNVTKISYLLASRDDAPLSFEHLKTVVQATREGGVDGNEL